MKLELAKVESIIIPHHNIPHLLRRCLLSVPKRNDLQIIVVDDCSDKNYKEDLYIIDKEFKNVEFYYSDTCRGGGAARNIGLERAVGKYLLFADADDFFNFCIHDIREFGIRKFFKNLVIWDNFCTFIRDYQLLIKN